VASNRFKLLSVPGKANQHYIQGISTAKKLLYLLLSHVVHMTLVVFFVQSKWGQFLAYIHHSQGHNRLTQGHLNV
jgi:hypothetical protein